MKNRRAGIWIACLLTLCFAAGVVAQNDNAGTKRRKFYHDADIATEYDKKRDETKVELRRVPVEVITFPGNPTLDITANFTYPGKVRQRPDVITLGFVAISTNHIWKFKESRELVAVLDNERLSLGVPELLESRNRTDYAREVLAMYVPFDTFLRLVNTPKDTLVMHMGNVKFELRKRELEALRDLASRAEP